MHTQARAIGLGAALAATALLLQGSTPVAADGTGGGHDLKTLTFNVEFSPFSYTDLGTPGPSAADVIVFHDQLRQNGKQVGDEVGSCVVVEPSGLSNCTGVIQIQHRGTIAFAFVNSPPPKKVLAVTGGSGQFRTAKGDGTLQENPDGTGTLVLRIFR